MFSVGGWLLLLIFLRDPTLKGSMKGYFFLRQATKSSSKIINLIFPYERLDQVQTPGRELKTRRGEV